MIVVRLMGGLGNQMFQYATGRRLADARHTRLHMDVSWFELANQVDAPREYELGCFTLRERFISPKRILLIDPTEPQSLKRKVYLRTKAAHKAKLIPYRENGIEFHKEVLWLPDKTYLEGFWQTENYFVGIRDTILRDFSFGSAISKQNQQILKAIQSSNSVSLHVRRGDYAAIKATTDFHGLMGLPYYYKATELIAKQIETPHFFIFSDEPEWCQKNLKLEFPTTYVAHNTNGSDDMMLMSHCQHHIVANSSFSWWGAWLNPSNKKIVYAPKQWFQEKSLNSRDIIPKAWNKL